MPTIIRSPTAVVVDPLVAGDCDWNNVNRILLEDGTCASSSVNVPHVTTRTSKLIRATGYDFSVINNSDVINSITLLLDRKADRALTVATIAYLINAGTVDGILSGLSQYWTDTLVEESNLTVSVGNLPSAVTLKNSLSGVAVAATFYDGDNTLVTAFINKIRLAVNYTSVIEEPLCFDLVSETPIYSLHNESHQFSLSGKDC
jgi:hypothetical protein